MPRQHKCRSINDATGTAVGSDFESRGHNSIGLFVIAENLDSANDTLEVVVDAAHEAEADGADRQYAGPALQSGSGPGSTQKLGLNETDLADPDGDGTFTGFVYGHGIPAEHFRARISSFTDSANGDLVVSAWLYFGNWNGPGREFREVV